MTDPQTKATLNSWALAAPALALLVMASIGPLLIVLVYSFMTPGDYSGVERPFTTQAWQQVFLSRDIFDDTLSWADAHLTIFWRSVKLSVLTTAIPFLLGLPTAWFIATRPPQRRAMWLFLITIPFWTNLLIRTFAVMELIRNEGTLNTFLMTIGVIDAPLQILFTETAIIIGMLYVYLPLMVLPLFAAIDRFDFRLIEAAYDLYASRLLVLRRIIVPIVRPGIVAGSILVFVPSLGAYVTPEILGGGRETMLGSYIVTQFLTARNWPVGASVSFVLMAVMLSATIVYFRAGGKNL